MILLKRMLLVLPACILLFFSVCVYADSELVTQNIYIEEEDYIAVSSKGGVWKIDYRCLPELCFEITESRQGLLQEGKTIYFYTDSIFQIENAIAPVCENGSVKIEMDTIQKPDKNIYALHLKRVTHEGKLPLSIRFSTYPYIDRISAKEKESVYFPLYLLSGPQYPDNLFEREEEAVLLNEKFFMAIDSAQENTTSQNDTARHVEIQVGENYLTCDGEKVPLSAPAYISENGVPMLPLRQTAENLDESIYIEYDSKNQAVMIQMYSRKAVLPIGGIQYFINDIPISYVEPMKMEDGKTFLSAIDMAYILSIPTEKAVWNPDTQILSFN